MLVDAYSSLMMSRVPTVLIVDTIPVRTFLVMTVIGPSPVYRLQEVLWHRRLVPLLSVLPVWNIVLCVNGKDK